MNFFYVGPNVRGAYDILNRKRVRGEVQSYFCSGMCADMNSLKSEGNEGNPFCSWCLCLTCPHACARFCCPLVCHPYVDQYVREQSLAVEKLQKEKDDIAQQRDELLLKIRRVEARHVNVNLELVRHFEQSNKVNEEKSKAPAEATPKPPVENKAKGSSGHKDERENLKSHAEAPPPAPVNPTLASLRGKELGKGHGKGRKGKNVIGKAFE